MRRAGGKTGKDGGKSRRELEAESRQKRVGGAGLVGWEGRGATTGSAPEC